MTVVNIVNVPVLVHSKSRHVFRPNAKPARTLAADAVGPTGSAEARRPAFFVMTSTVPKFGWRMRRALRSNPALSKPVTGRSLSRD